MLTWQPHVDEPCWNNHEDGGEYCMKHEDADIEADELRITNDLPP